MTRSAGLCAGTLVALGALLVWAAPAAAHAQLESTDPPANAVLDEPPERIVVRFTESVGADDGDVRVFDRTGERVDDGRLIRPDGGRTVGVEVPELDDGGYVVTWHVVSADAHPIQGGVTFRVGPPTTEAVDQSLVNELVAADGGNTTVGAVYAVVRFLAFAGLLLLVGGASFVAMAWPAGAGLRRVRALLWGAWGTLLVATVAGIGLQGAYTGALELADAFEPSVIGDVLDTRFGTAWAGRVLLLAVAAPLLVVLARGRASGPWWRATAAAVGAGLVVTPALSGHASAGDLVPLAFVADVVHVAAVSLWLGGLVMLAVGVLPRREPAELRAVVPWFSALALGCVIAIVASGAFQGWRQVDGLAGLTDTNYGRLLLAKTFAFAGLVVLGAFGRMTVRRHLWGPADAVVLPAGPGAMRADPDDEPVRRLRASVGVEVAVAVVILTLTALLVNADPARSASAEPFGATLTASEHATIDVSMVPAQVGGNDLHLFVSTADGSFPVDAEAEMSLPEQDIGPIALPLQPAGPAHWSAYGFDLPIAGEWELAVITRLGETEQVTAETTVSVAGR